MNLMNTNIIYILIKANASRNESNELCGMVQMSHDIIGFSPCDY
jgi:hypothetical protein